MANFNTHITTAACLSISGSLLIFTSGCITAQQSILLALIGTLGGILPDIDSDNSTSIKLIFRLVSLSISLILLFYFLPKYGLIITAPCAIVSYFCMTMPIRNIFEKFTIHRGIFHSVPMGVFISLSTTLTCIIFKQPLFIAWAIGLFILFGFLIHLCLDEIYSVDLSGARLKRSFGTAFKLFNRDQLKLYILIYIGIMTLSFFLKDHLPDILYNHQKQHFMWDQFLSHLWPQSNHPQIITQAKL